MLDKAAIVLGALEAGPSTLAQLVAATGLARPTAHRLAVALEHHRLVSRDMQGRFVLGPRLGELASAAGEDRLLAAAGPVLGALRDHTDESAQLFRRQGDQRICVAAAERPMGLRDSIPVGATLTMLAGSAAQVLLAWEEPDRLHRGLQGARFTATTLSGVRRRGWAQSVGEREPGVASVSAPVRGPVRPGRGRRVDLRPDRAPLPPARAHARRHRGRRRQQAHRGAAPRPAGHPDPPEPPGPAHLGPVAWRPQSPAGAGNALRRRTGRFRPDRPPGRRTTWRRPNTSLAGAHPAEPDEVPVRGGRGPRCCW